MLSNTILPSLLSVAALLATANATLDPIVIKGNKFFKKTSGDQFYIKGVAYQQGVGSGGSGSNNTDYTDPLADASSCKRDVPYLQKLGMNAIRTYAIDPTADHSTCMSLLDAAGIYVISDLSEPNTSINRDDPAWNIELYTRYTAVIDELQQYSNVIGFFAGNEVSNSPQTTNATAFVKAAVRDMKSYIKTKGYREMGVGYAADDDATSRANVANYLNCGDATDSIDFWGYNIYEWCGKSSFTSSGYDQRTAEFKNFTVPAFFAEYGCNNNGAAARPFTEVGALYGSQMNDVFSGGIVYEYFEETNDFGLVSVSGDNVKTLSPEFDDLATQLSASATATGVNSASFTATNTQARSCPTVGTSWQAASGLPPTPNSELCACMVKSLSCVAKSSISSSDLGDLFGQVCGYNNGAACAGIAKTPSTGTYGAYSMCAPADQLSFAFDAYFKSQGSKSDACDFSGNAQTQTGSTASSCSALISQAGTAGTGTVTSAPTGGTAASSSKAAAAGITVGGSMTSFGFAMVAYLVGAAAMGAGMIVL